MYSPGQYSTVGLYNVQLNLEHIQHFIQSKGNGGSSSVATL
jgi:hypothetical protein